jgi:hypothetical protein
MQTNEQTRKSAQAVSNSLAARFASFDPTSPALMTAKEAGPIIDQILCHGESVPVVSLKRKIGNVVTFGNWSILVASVLIPRGTVFAGWEVSRKSERVFGCYLVRKGQSAPAYAGNDFKFRNL